MKCILHKFPSDIKEKVFYKAGEDYEASEYEVTSAEVQALLRQLVNERDSLYVDVSEDGVLLFHLDSDKCLWVEITYYSSFWALSKITWGMADPIIDGASQGQAFSSRIPSTNTEWDAYSFPGR